jgi:hypothetical protein
MNNKLLFLFLVISFFSKNVFSQAGEWTWIKGYNSISPQSNYGTLGISSPMNNPPGVYGANSWTDNTGNFWFYGGVESTVANLNDLWKFDTLTKEWTWMSGTHTINDFGNYGSRGVPSATNRPPGIGLGAATWTDLNNNLWIFGGFINRPGPYNGPCADLWKYDIGTNTWTWMKGPGTLYAAGVFGTITIADTSNYPPARYESTTAWVDSNNDLWLFGGRHTNAGDFLNDVWKYNIASNTWTWMKGSNLTNQPSVHVNQGVETPWNVPCGRQTYTHWKDSSGNCWIFGGVNQSTVLSDLWRYNSATNNWTWMGGTDTSGYASFGLQCIPSTSNWPRGRFENRANWVDAYGNFWMYGGVCNSGLSDLWKYDVGNGRWTFVDGDTISNVNPHWGTLNVFSPTNNPGARIGAVGFSGNNDQLILFGGQFYGNGIYNDLWIYKIDTACASNTSLVSNFIPGISSFCEGECVNFINLSVNSNSYQWLFPGGTPSSDTSANPQNICYASQGNYDVTLIASNGSVSDTFSVANAIVVFPPLSFSPVYQSNDTLFSVSGFMNYQWYYDSTLIAGANSYYYIPSLSGTYSVQVTDSNGCSSIATILGVITTSGNSINANNDLTVVVYDHAILINYFSSGFSSGSIKITNDLGENLQTEKFSFIPGENNLTLSEIKLATGIYFVNVFAENKFFSKKFFVK